MALPSFILFAGDLYDSERDTVTKLLKAASYDEKIGCSCKRIRALISGDGVASQRVLTFEFRCECGKLFESRKVAGGVS